MPEFNKEQASGGPAGLGSNEEGVLIDAFTQSKHNFLLKFRDVKKEIQDLHSPSSGANGSSFSSGVLQSRTKTIIQQQQKIRSDLKELNTLYNILEGVYLKENKKKVSKKSEDQQDSMDDKAGLLTQLKIQLEKLKESSKTGFQSDKNKDGMSHNTSRSLLFGAQTSGFVSSSSTPSNGVSATSAINEIVELTENQQLELKTIQQRDQEFDRMLEQIETAVDTAGEMAKKINSEADVQNQMLKQVDAKMEKVEEHIVTVNAKMKKTVVSSTGCTFERLCINMICFVLLLGIIGSILQVVT